VGLIAGVVIALYTTYMTSYEDPPTRLISEASEYGTPPVIIKGLGLGMMSTSVPMISVVVTIIVCNKLCGNYGVAIAAVGMLCTLGITLATDAYGPVADNAGGLAEMAGLDPRVRNRTDKLDSLGNTTAATARGWPLAARCSPLWAWWLPLWSRPCPMCTLATARRRRRRRCPAPPRAPPA